jgi:hypothetical protein
MPDRERLQIEFTGDLAKITASPGDRFVLRLPRKVITTENVQSIQDTWRHFIGDDSIYLLILPEDYELTKIEHEET